MYLRENK